MTAPKSYDLEKLEKTSRTTGVATLIGALIVIGALVFSTVRLSQMQEDVEVLQARSEALAELIESRQSELEELGQLIAEAQRELEAIDATPRSGRPAQAEVIEKSETARKTLERAAQTYAEIRTKDVSREQAVRGTTVLGLQVCRRVEDLQPFDCGDTFEPATLYAWARLNVLQPETVSIRLVNANGETVREDPVKVEKSPGYRIYGGHAFTSDDAGRYEVQIYDSKGRLLAKKRFTVAA